MKKWIHTIAAILLMASIALGQDQSYTISGYIKDASNGETLIGADVYFPESGEGVATNEYGFYSISLPEGKYTAVVSYLGYAEKTVPVSLTEDKTLSIELEDDSQIIEEVVVTAVQEDRNVKDIQMSVNKLDIATIKKIPSLLGERDVIKSIQLLPGISTVGEGASGFNVRGGSIDQNLVILDEAPVFNSSHLFGFFSVFNPDAVKDVKLYKGGIPARYGGRLSSILDVRMKEGNKKQLEVNGGVGTIFSRLSVEAPITDKMSFVVAGRRSYIDVLAKPFLKNGLENSVLNFYDLTMKTNYDVSDKDRLFLSGYFGRDNFGFGAGAGFNWGNQTGTLRWNHLFSDKLFANTTFYYSNYDYKLNFGDTAQDKFNWNARIINYSLKPEFTYFLRPNNKVRFGGQTTYMTIQPANAVSINNGKKIDFSVDYQYAFESAAYVEHEIKLIEPLEINYGLRFSHFAYLGGRDKYSYGEPFELGTQRPLTKVEAVDKWDVIKDYYNFEPRIAINYTTSERNSIKASYMRTSQYIHLLSNTTASTPIDIWTPSTNNIAPQKADQWALGYFQNFNKNNYELTVETYYKDMYDLIDYVDGADLILNTLVEGQVLKGVGRAYGAEFQFKKTRGDFNGWISYTLSRSERKVEGINKGEWYPNRFDKLHNLSIAAFYEINKRLTLSANFVYSTGTPTTFATSRYTIQGYVVPHVTSGLRNNVRVPDYHRLDLALTINPRQRKGKRWEGEWVIGVYNAYNRRNPFTIFFKQDDARPLIGQQTNTQAVRFSVIGSIIPSISYNFKFK